MTTFLQVRNAEIVAHFDKDMTLDEAKAAYTDIAGELHVSPVPDPQDGWEFTDDYCGPLRVELGQAIAAALMQIDSDVDSIYAVVIGNRVEEYRVAEAEAYAFIQAGYEGAAPGSVQSWATAKGWTAQQAADDIAATAAAWRAAQAAIRAQRLLRKEQVRVAANAAAVNAVLAAWSAFVTAVRAQLGIGGP